MELSEEAREKRRAYYRSHYAQNRDRINAQRRRRNAKDPGEDCWKKAGFRKRASWEELGISEKRRRELKEIARRDEYADIVTEAALRIDRLAAPHVILAVTKNLSYELVEFDARLGRCPVGKTAFYAERRLFFHYLDELLKE